MFVSRRKYKKANKDRLAAVERQIELESKLYYADEQMRALRLQLNKLRTKGEIQVIAPRGYFPTGQHRIRMSVAGINFNIMSSRASRNKAMM